MGCLWVPGHTESHTEGLLVFTLWTSDFVPAGHCRGFVRILRPGAVARCASVHMKVGWSGGGGEAGQTPNPCSSPSPSLFRSRNQNQDPAWNRSHLPQPSSYPLPPVSWEHPSALSCHLAQPSSTLWPIRQAVPSGVPTLPHPCRAQPLPGGPPLGRAGLFEVPDVHMLGPSSLGGGQKGGVRVLPQHLAPPPRLPGDAIRCLPCWMLVCGEAGKASICGSQALVWDGVGWGELGRGFLLCLSFAFTKLRQHPRHSLSSPCYRK